jgi:hypothetical protein
MRSSRILRWKIAWTADRRISEENRTDIRQIVLLKLRRPNIVAGMTRSDRDLLSPRTIARMHGCTPQTVRRWMHRGVAGVRLDAVQIGLGWYTTPEALAAFLARRDQFAEG